MHVLIVHNGKRLHDVSLQYYIFLTDNQSTEKKKVENYPQKSYSHNGFRCDNVNINHDITQADTRAIT